MRLGKVSEKLGKYSDALHSYKRAFVCMMSASTADEQIQVEILTDMSLLCRFAVGKAKAGISSYQSIWFLLKGVFSILLKIIFFPQKT